MKEANKKNVAATHREFASVFCPRWGAGCIERRAVGRRAFARGGGRSGCVSGADLFTARNIIDVCIAELECGRRLPGRCGPWTQPASIRRLRGV